VRVVNSPFDRNARLNSACGHLSTNINSANPAYTRAAVIANGSFTRASCAGPAGRGYDRGCGVGLGRSSPLKAAIANGVVFDNQIADLNAERGLGTPRRRSKRSSPMALRT